MVAGRKHSMPCVYGDTPTFLGVPLVKTVDQMCGKNVVVLGVPWEGTITWGSYSGCELSPKTIRHAAARYGGYLPELDLDFFDYLQIGDAGDVAVVPGDEYATMKLVEARVAEVLSAGAVPLLIGGDHSFTPAAIDALGKKHAAIGIIHLDAHFDNNENFGDDNYARCSPLMHIAKNPKVKKTSIVHLGIRGPRNSKLQMQHARESGATVLTILDIREQGFARAIDKTIAIAKTGTDAIYVTICSDILDASLNPGGPADFDGLSSAELFYALRRIGEQGFCGLDFVEIYPLQDSFNRSSHLAAWSLINALAGMALSISKRP